MQPEFEEITYIFKRDAPLNQGRRIRCTSYTGNLKRQIWVLKSQDDTETCFSDEVFGEYKIRLAGFSNDKFLSDDIPSQEHKLHAVQII